MTTTNDDKTGSVIFNGQEFIVRDSDGFNLGVFGGYAGHKLAKAQRVALAHSAVKACLAPDGVVHVEQTRYNTYKWRVE
jgi:hypothetical protein